MALSTLALSDLISKSDYSEEKIEKLLCSFESLRTEESTGSEDVEFFIHNKALQFEKMDLARTYLVMSTYQSKYYLAGYFSLSNKPLIIPNKQFNKMSNSLKRRLMGIGHRTEQKSYEIKGFLLGQLGRNYNDIAVKANNCSGDDLLTLCYEKIREAHRLVGGRILHLECENNEKLIGFYERNGFSLIEDYESANGYRVMVKQMRHI